MTNQDDLNEFDADMRKLFEAWYRQPPIKRKLLRMRAEVTLRVGVPLSILRRALARQIGRLRAWLQDGRRG